MSPPDQPPTKRQYTGGGNFGGLPPVEGAEFDNDFERSESVTSDELDEPEDPRMGLPSCGEVDTHEMIQVWVKQALGADKVIPDLDQNGRVMGV